MLDSLVLMPLAMFLICSGHQIIPSAESSQHDTRESDNIDIENSPPMEVVDTSDTAILVQNVEEISRSMPQHPINHRVEHVARIHHVPNQVDATTSGPTVLQNTTSNLNPEIAPFLPSLVSK